MTIGIRTTVCNAKWNGRNISPCLTLTMLYLYFTIRNQPHIPFSSYKAIHFKMRKEKKKKLSDVWHIGIDGA